MKETMRSELLRFGELYQAIGGREIYERLRITTFSFKTIEQGL